MFLMWLGEQITSRGIGNGISLIIFAGIVARLPVGVWNLLEKARLDSSKTLQIFGYHVAVRRGCDVDQPRNLAKTVTVE